MKYYAFILLVYLSSCEKRISNKGEKIISNKEIAISIAEKKWKKVYGKSEIDKQKPFAVEKKNDSIWIVHGSFPSPPAIGGVAYAEVNIKIKKVIKYPHGE
jgi:hypothetical protein